MTAAKRKGTSFESACRDWMIANGIPDARRIAPTGAVDTGDVTHRPPPDVIYQMKDYANLTSALREGLEGAVKQAKAAGVSLGVAVVKRRGKGPQEAYVVMRMTDWVALVRDIREGRWER